MYTLDGARFCFASRVSTDIFHPTRAVGALTLTWLVTPKLSTIVLGAVDAP